MTYIEVSKLDAAKRQLDLAIKLMFHNGDPVAIHALSANANDILRGLANKQGAKSIIYDEIMETIKPEMRKKFKDILREAQNFIKHPSNSQKNVRLSPTATEIMIFDDCMLYLRLTKENTGLHFLFKFWFFIKNPNIVTDTARDAFKLANETLDPNDKAFFWTLLPLSETKAQGLNEVKA